MLLVWAVLPCRRAVAWHSDFFSFVAKIYILSKLLYILIFYTFYDIIFTNYRGEASMIDIHCHLIPNIDDGAESIEEACEMLSLAYDAGTLAMVATPHYYNSSQCSVDSSRAMVCEAYRRLKEEVARRRLPINIYLGAEQFGINDMLGLVAANEIITINSSKYVLIEFDFCDDIRRVNYCLTQLIKSGYVPIVAHPERYEFFQESPYSVYDILDLGCLLQVNKGSPLGRYGNDEERLSWWLLEHQIVHFIASDCHGIDRRSPDMRESRSILSQVLPADYVQELFYENPMSVLKNEDIL